MAEIITYGGIVRRLLAPGRGGHLDDVVLGFDQLESYLEDRAYVGAIVGRVAGRIPAARFYFEGKIHKLTQNDGNNHLHGGFKGFNKRLWKATPIVESPDRPSLRLEYLSQDGEEGYPGSVNISVTYTVTPENALLIRSEAASDRTTPLSLTFHSYFNLGGDGSHSIADHELQVHADEYVAVDQNMTLLGASRSVTRSNDFRHRRRLGDVIPYLFQNHGDLYRIRRTDGREEGATLMRAARLMHPPSGRALDVSTTASYLQLYTGVGLDGSCAGKQGASYERYAGVCLECEGYPDGANDPSMGNILLHPGQLKTELTQFAFSIF